MGRTVWSGSASGTRRRSGTASSPASGRPRKGFRLPPHWTPRMSSGRPGAILRVGIPADVQVEVREGIAR